MVFLENLVNLLIFKLLRTFYRLLENKFPQNCSYLSTLLTIEHCIQSDNMIYLPLAFNQFINYGIDKK